MESITLCRCCLTSGLHKNLYRPYLWFDTREVYSMMLQECFNVSLFQYEDPSSNTICDECIAALRSSLQFKTKVIQADRDFLKTINKFKDKVSDDIVTIKKEAELDNSYDSDDVFLADTVSESTVEQIKVEQDSRAKKPGSEVKCKSKSSLQESKSRSNIKSLVSRLASATSINFKPADRNIKKETNNTLFSLRRIGKVSSKPKTNKHLLEDIATSRVKTKPIADARKSSFEYNSLPPHITEFLYFKKDDTKLKNQQNIETILRYSNAIPFKTKSYDGYACEWCSKSYPDPKDLRTHTLQDHTEARLKYAKRIGEMKNLKIKLDITDLTCTICNSKFKNLNLFITHLVESHKKPYNNDTKDHILQFSLKKGDRNDCILCDSTYEKFRMLLLHMNVHSTNYVCTVCDGTFVTKTSLAAHKKTHTNGSFKCGHCDNVYSSRDKRKYHEKMVHFGRSIKIICPHCDKSFSTYYKRNLHLIQVHNSKAEYKCNVCDKLFIVKNSLTRHIKKYHLMERNHECAECGHKSFTARALRLHMVKHTGEKNYLCDVCNKAFGRRFTLVEHMRIHTNDRRFRCDVCAATFVQKCSLKSHLFTNHGIAMAANEIKRIDE